MNGWRDLPITERQKECIADMMEFSCYPLPKFEGSTRGEASEYIEKYGKLSHEDVSGKCFGY